jgi:hypothetical protein
MRKFATVFATLACLLLAGRADAGGYGQQQAFRGRSFAPRAQFQFNFQRAPRLYAPQQQFFVPQQQFYVAPQQQFYAAPAFRAPPVFRAPDYCPPQGRAFFPGY